MLIDNVGQEIESLLTTNPEKALQIAEEAYGLALQNNNQTLQLELSILQLKAFRILGRTKQGLDKMPEFLALHQKANNTEGFAECLFYASIFNFSTSQFTIAKTYIIQAIELFEQLQLFDNITESLNIYGCVLMEMGEYSLAYGNFTKCIENAKKFNKNTIHFKALTNIAKIHYLLEEFEESMAVIRQAQAINEEIDNVYLKTTFFANYGLLFNQIGNYDEALIFLNKALPFADEHNFENIKIPVLSQLAFTYIQKNDLKMAFKYAKRGIDISNKNQIFDVNYLGCLGKYLICLNHQKEYEKVICLAENSIEYSKKERDERTQEQILQQLLIAYKACNKLPEALATAEEIIEIERSIFKNKSTHTTLRSKFQYEIEQNQLKMNHQNEIITLMQKANAQIEAENVKYEKEISHRIDLEERLMNLNNELAAFSVVASHDMREPLRTIASYAQLLKRRLIKSDDSNNELIDFIIDASKRMQTLLSDLIGYTRVNNASVEFEQVELNQLLAIVQANLRLSIEETNTIITIKNTLPQVKATRTLLNLVFQNLIENAIKYRKPNTAPIIEIYYHEGPNTHLISIQDNGIGIDPEYQEVIFEPFRRLHSKADYEGSGIGLATVKRIVEDRLNGNISLISALGKGSTFTIELPK